MINEIIKDQLNKVEVAKVGPYDELKNQFIIPKHVEPVYEVNHCYLIQLDKSLTTSTGNAVLVANWNKGSYPLYDGMKISVNNKLGNMINVDGLYYNFTTNEDINIMWSGWLPVDLITMIKEI